MAETGLTIFDGSQLSDADVSLPPPPPDTAITGAEVLELAETRASLSLLGFVLPETLKCSALRRIGVSDTLGFRSKKLDYSDACTSLRNYISAIADELKDDPIAVTILDGGSLNMFLEDEDDFAMLAENLFTDLDVEDRGKISKDEIQSALAHMGIESGVPPVSEYPQLNDIFKKHGAAGKEELGQAQFAQLLQPVLQELADSLVMKPVVVVLRNIKLANGSKLKKLLAKERLPDDAVEKIMEEKYERNGDQSCATKIKFYLEKHGDDFGLPPSQLPEMAVLLDEIFTEVDSENGAAESDRDSLMVFRKKILEKIAEKLEASPILYDLQVSQLEEA
ncbi:uncharacterized protein LOC131014373 [Salvia miltiorrhiza]|uniref:uncharacterized protein LOC131014373 n=1 Tax=Salvia miltiorrhiza TaxID=226208 RepID=UPI0025ACB611|nr:uncharacterized protein LOC131014373 [Salvia miltiorrhiza]